MPLYDFRCKECKHEFETMCKYSEIPEVGCPECGSDVQHLVTGTDFRLKGANWQGVEISTSKKDYMGGKKRYTGDNTS